MGTEEQEPGQPLLGEGAPHLRKSHEQGGKGRWDDSKTLVLVLPLTSSGGVGGTVSVPVLQGGLSCSSLLDWE